MRFRGRARAYDQFERAHDMVISVDQINIHTQSFVQSETRTKYVCFFYVCTHVVYNRIPMNLKYCWLCVCVNACRLPGSAVVRVLVLCVSMLCACFVRENKSPSCLLTAWRSRMATKTHKHDFTIFMRLMTCGPNARAYATSVPPLV